MEHTPACKGAPSVLLKRASDKCAWPTSPSLGSGGMLAQRSRNQDHAGWADWIPLCTWTATISTDKWRKSPKPNMSEKQESTWQLAEIHEPFFKPLQLWNHRQSSGEWRNKQTTRYLTGKKLNWDCLTYRLFCCQMGPADYKHLFPTCPCMMLCPMAAGVPQPAGCSRGTCRQLLLSTTSCAPAHPHLCLTAQKVNRL